MKLDESDYQKGKRAEEKIDIIGEEIGGIGENGENSVGFGVRNLILENRIEREWLSTKEAAFFMSISENALRIMVHREQIQVYRMGRRLRFKVRECRQLFERKGT